MSGSLSYYHSYPSRGGGGGGGGGSSAFSTDNMSHRYISRGLPEDSSGGTYHSLSYAHSLITTPFYGVDQSYDDATDHGGRKMGGDKSSARDRLTQSYHTHQTHYTRPRQPYYTYHPPVTTPPLHRTNSGYSSSPSHYRSSHGNGYHDDRLNSYHDERRRDLTTTVSFPQSQGSSARGLSYDWLTHSWSQSMSPKPHPSPLSTPLDSPSDPHPDSSPPTTINHRSVASVTANSAHSLAIRSALPTSATHSCASHSKGTPYIDIISHPEDVMIPPNAKSFELVCEARVLHSNESPLYQWYKDEEPLIGEVGGSLVREVMCEEDTGFYFCIVSDSGGVTQRKSRQAYVCMDDEEVPTVHTSPSPPLIIEQPPSSMTILIGARLHLKLVVQATPEPTYRWFKNGVELPFVIGPELMVPSVTVRDVGKYMCSIRNEWGSVLSGEIDVRLLSKTQRSSSDSQLSIDDLEDHEIALPPSYTAPSSPRKHPTSLSFRSAPPLLLPDSPSMEGGAFFSKGEVVTEAALKVVTGQIKRRVDSSYRIERLAFCLNVHTIDLANIRLRSSTVEEQVFQILKKWKAQTYHPSVSLLEDSLRTEGFMISVPHIESNNSFNTASGGGLPTPPVIVEHPQSLYAPCDSNVSFQILAEGEGLQYQWYRNNNPLPGQTTPTLNLIKINEAARGLYHCVVSGCHGSSTSRPAHLTVTLGKLRFPLPQTNRKGTRHGKLLMSQSESAIPSSSPLQDLQFPRRGSVDTFYNASMDSMGSSSHQVLHGNNGVTELLQNMKLDKSTKPVIIEHPLSQEVAMGDPLQLSVLVDPPDGIKYIWYFNGLALHKETLPEFFLHCFTEEDIGDYYCEISNNCDSIKSDIAKVTLKEEDKEEEKR